MRTSSFWAVLLITCVACGDDDPADGGTGGSGGATGGGGGTAGSGAIGGGTGGSTGGEGGAGAVGGLGGSGGTGGTAAVAPSLSEIAWSVQADNALRVDVTFVTDLDAEAWITFEPTDPAVGQALQTTARTTAGTEHQITLYGMLPETEYTFEIHAETPDGGLAVSPTLIATTEALPAGVVDLQVAASTSTYAGYLLTKIPSSDWLSIHDMEGRVVWYQSVPLEATSGNMFKLLPSGRLVSLGQDHLTVMSLSGEILMEHARPGTIVPMHHDATELPNGDIAALTAYLGDAPNDTLVGDGIDVITADGTVVWEWRLFDHIDPADWTSIGGTFWESLGGDDWSHGNSLQIGPNGDYFMSLRHLNMVLKIDGQTGAPIWSLGGTSSDFTLDPNEVFYRQHNAFPRDDGTLSIYDNGHPNTRPWTRVIELSLDEVNDQAQVVWEHDFDMTLFCQIVGSSYLAANGSRFITCGTQARVFEVSATNELLFDASFAGGGLVYRFQPLETLNPMPTAN